MKIKSKIGQALAMATVLGTVAKGRAWPVGGVVGRGGVGRGW